MIATQIITVKDDIAPVLIISTLPSLTSTIKCSETIPIAAVQALDNCSTAPINATFSDSAPIPLVGLCPLKYKIERIWSAIDTCGNVSATFLQTINFEDDSAPVIDPAFQTTIPATCDNLPPVVQPNLLITDNCAITGNGLVVTQLADVTSTVTSTGTFTITRAWEATDGCNPVTFTQIVNVTIPNYVQQAPQINANCNIDNRIEINLLEQIQKTYPAVAINGTWIDINSALGNNLDTANGIFEPYNVPVGVYYLEYKNPDPCPSVIKFSIRVDDDCTVENCATLGIYNYLTPGNDTVNESLIIEGIDSECYNRNNIEIFNRWGIKVYEKDNYDNITNPFTGVSDGRSTIKKGELLPTGTYFYFLKFDSPIGDIEPKSGFIYLTRE